MIALPPQVDKRSFPSLPLKLMEVHFAPETEQRLHRLAQDTGRNAEQVVQEAVERLIGEDAAFVAAAQKGFDSLDRGEFLTHEEVGARIDRFFKSE
jgi:predicted transcriptional regulator